MTTNRSTVTYAALIAAILIPLAQKHGITLTVDDIVDGAAALAVAYHSIASFVESRWPPKTSNPEVIEAVTRAVLVELKSNVPFVQPEEKSK
ncbi:MAG: hypothetical protein WBW84_19740 [Acidobacteriaceae bacterium]